jgi:hypothetical protein
LLADRLPNPSWLDLTRHLSVIQDQSGGHCQIRLKVYSRIRTVLLSRRGLQGTSLQKEFISPSSKRIGRRSLSYRVSSDGARMAPMPRGRMAPAPFLPHHH